MFASFFDVLKEIFDADHGFIQAFCSDGFSFKRKLEACVCADVICRKCFLRKNGGAFLGCKNLFEFCLKTGFMSVV